MRFDLKAEIEKVWDNQLTLEYDILEQYHGHIESSHRFLEIGCGSLGFLERKGNRLNKLFKHSIGIDINLSDLGRNRQVRYPVCASCYSLPLPPNSVDIVMCRWVFEHLEHPEVVMREVRRVLRESGHFIVTTSNLLNYAMWISRFTPTSFHTLVRGKENSQAFYRANTMRSLRKLAKMHGFEVQFMGTTPYAFMYYSRFNKYLFLSMKGLSNLTSEALSKFHLKIICVMKKRDNL